MPISCEIQDITLEPVLYCLDQLIYVFLISMSMVPLAYNASVKGAWRTVWWFSVLFEYLWQKFCLLKVSNLFYAS